MLLFAGGQRLFWTAMTHSSGSSPLFLTTIRTLRKVTP